MKQILFSIGHIHVYGYGVMIAIGIISGLTLLIKRSSKRGYDEDHILSMAIWAVIGGVLGGKLLYIITEMKTMIYEPSNFIKNIGYGFVIYGAIIGGVLGVYLYCRKRKWDFLRVFDMTIPSLAIGQAFGRIGCFFAGCCYGIEAPKPWGVLFKEDSLCPINSPVLPTQLYSSAFDFILTFILLYIDKKNNKKGRVFCSYLIIYSIGRFCVEFFRNDPRGNVGILSTSQFISIFTLIVGILFYNYEKIKSRLIGDKREEN